jgi:hypothetical protein
MKWRSGFHYSAHLFYCFPHYSTVKSGEHQHFAVTYCSHLSWSIFLRNVGSNLQDCHNPEDHVWNVLKHARYRMWNGATCRDNGMQLFGEHSTFTGHKKVALNVTYRWRTSAEYAECNDSRREVSKYSYVNREQTCRSWGHLGGA